MGVQRGDDGKILPLAPIRSSTKYLTILKILYIQCGTTNSLFMFNIFMIKGKSISLKKESNDYFPLIII